MKIIVKFFGIIVALLFSNTSYSQLSIAALNTDYTQDFNGLGTSNATWSNNSTIANVYAARTGSASSITASTGSSTTGDLYNFGSSASSDRALGNIGSSNSVAGDFAWGIRLKNNTTATLTSLTISYVGEQWRDAGNNPAVAQVVEFFYLTSTSAITSFNANSTGYTAVTGLNFSSPKFTTTAAALDGNATANKTAITFTITGLNILAGSEIMLKWLDINHTGSDHGLAIDDFKIKADGITNYYLKTAGSCDVLANWGTNSDGTGTVPTSFTANKQVFNVVNQTVATLAANWDVTGTGSKVIVGNVSTAVTLDIPALFIYTGNAIDVTNNAILLLKNTTIPTFGTLGTNATINYGSATNQNITTTTYPNLIASGSGNKSLSNSLTINGNLSILNSAVLDAGTTAITLTLTNGLTLDNTATVSANFRDYVSVATIGNTLQSFNFNGLTFSCLNFTSIKNPLTAGSGGITIANNIGTFDIKGNFVLEYDQGANYAIFTANNNIIKVGGASFKVGKDGSGTSNLAYVLANSTVILTGESATSDVEISENFTTNTTPTINCIFYNLHVIKSLAGTWNGNFKFKGSSNTTIFVNNDLFLSGAVKMIWQDNSPARVVKPLYIGKNITLTNGAKMDNTCLDFLQLITKDFGGNNSANTQIWNAQNDTIKAYEFDITKAAGGIFLRNNQTTLNCKKNFKVNLSNNAARFVDSNNVIIVGDDLLLTATVTSAGDSTNFPLTGTFKMTGETTTDNVKITDYNGGTGTIDVALNNLEAIKNNGTWKLEMMSSTTSNTAIVIKNNLVLNKVELLWDNTAQTKPLFIGGNITLVDTGSLGITCLNNLLLNTMGNKNQVFKGEKLRAYDFISTKTAGYLKLANNSPFELKRDFICSYTGTSLFADSANTITVGDDLGLTAAITNSDTVNYKLKGTFLLNGASLTNGTAQISDAALGTGTIDPALYNLTVKKTANNWTSEFSSSATSNTTITILNKLTFDNIVPAWLNTNQSKKLAIGKDFHIINGAALGLDYRNNATINLFGIENQNVWQSGTKKIGVYNFEVIKSLGNAGIQSTNELDIKNDFTVDLTNTAKFIDSGININVGDDIKLNAPTIKSALIDLTGKISMTAEMADANADIENGSNGVCDAILNKIEFKTNANTNFRFQPLIATDSIKIKDSVIITEIGATNFIFLNNNFFNLCGNINNESAISNILDEGNSTLKFEGTAKQNVTSITPLELFNININNPNNLIFDKDLKVKGTMDFENGIYKNRANNKVLIFENGSSIGIAANNNSYADGVVKKIGNTPFIFPIGDSSNVGVHQVEISAPSLTTDAFEAKYYRQNPETLGDLSASTKLAILYLSSCEFWDLKRVNGTSNVDVSIYFNMFSNCGGSLNYITDTAGVLIVHFDSTNALWDTTGRAKATGNALNGKITWKNVSKFSPFTFGSNTSANPLPLLWLSVKGKNNGTNNEVVWAINSEKEVDTFVVEKLINNKFTYIKGNYRVIANNTYSFLDNTNTGTINYYRVKAFKRNMAYFYSPVVSISSFNNKQILFMFPNPATDFITLQFNNKSSYNSNIQIFDSKFSKVISITYEANELNNTKTVNVADLLAGVYFIKIGNAEYSQFFKFIKQ